MIFLCRSSKYPWVISSQLLLPANSSEWSSLSLSCHDRKKTVHKNIADKFSLFFSVLRQSKQYRLLNIESVYKYTNYQTGILDSCIIRFGFRSIQLRFNSVRFGLIVRCPFCSLDRYLCEQSISNTLFKFYFFLAKSVHLSSCLYLSIFQSPFLCLLSCLSAPILLLPSECCCKRVKTPHLTTIESSNISTITGSSSHSTYAGPQQETALPPNYDEIDPPPSYATLFPGNKTNADSESTSSSTTTSTTSTQPVANTSSDSANQRIATVSGACGTSEHIANSYATAQQQLQQQQQQSQQSSSASLPSSSSLLSSS